MLYDIAEEMHTNGVDCILICGRELNRKGIFTSIIVFNEYERSSALSRLSSWLKFTRNTHLWLKVNADSYSSIFMVSNPPFNLYIPLFNKKIRNKNTSYLIYDLYPDIFRKMMPFISLIPSFIMKILNKRSFQYINNIYTPSEGLKSAVRKYTDKKITTVYNWTNLDLIRPIPKYENRFLRMHQLQDKFIVLYSGNLGKTHDTDTLLKCTELTKDNNSIAYVFIGHGDGMNKVLNKIQEGSKNIYYFPWQEDEMFLHSIACGDLAWVGYRKGFEEYSIPSKLPFFLASGTPVISIGEKESELTKLITNNKAGYHIANGASQELAALLQELQNNPDDKMKLHCIETASKLFSRENAKILNANVS